MNVALLLLFIGLAAGVSGAELVVEGKPVKQVRCELLVVRLAAAKAVALQNEMRNPKAARVAVDKLVGLVEKNQAELVDWPMVSAISGKRGVAENVELGSRVWENGTRAVQPTSRDAEEKASRPLPRNATAPTDGKEYVDRWRAGVTMEIEPEIGPDGESIAAKVEVHHVRLVEDLREERAKSSGPQAPAHEAPSFDECRVATNLLFRSGEPRLVGFFELREPKDVVEVFLLTLTIDETKSPAPRAAGPVGAVRPVAPRRAANKR